MKKTLVKQSKKRMTGDREVETRTAVAKETAKSLTDHELRVAALNVDGVLFQEKVRHCLQSAGLEFHASEFGVDTGSGNLYRESKLDLWFRHRVDGCLFEILVECKKADPRLKEWLFFQSHDPRPLITLDSARRGQDALWKRFRFNAKLDAYYAFAGRELKGQWGKGDGDQWKTSSDRIEKACDQVSIATNSIASSLVDVQEHTRRSGGAPHFLVPVVVTSASIFSCDFNGGSGSPVESEIAPSQVSVASAESLIMRHALSSHLHPDLFVDQDEMSRDFVRGSGYMDILIAQPRAAAERILELCKEVAREYQPHLRG